MLRKHEHPNRATWARKALRHGYVLRYHRPSQLAMRLVRLAQKHSIRVTRGQRYARAPEALLKPRIHADLGRLAERKLAERRLVRSRAGAEELLAGRYRLLNVVGDLPDPIDWRLEGWPEAPHLWRFHLHYHEFLLDLAVESRRTGEPKWADRAWNVVTQWIDGNRLSDPRALIDAWHPFCISRRLPTWIALWAACPPADSRRDRIAASMFCQVRYLEDHLERDLGGNHLLENARALVLVGCFLEGPDARRWRRTGAKILRAELPRQILPHGEHFERSAAYHAEMLEALLDVRDATRRVMPDLARWCAETAGKMAGFLAGILHPDGDLPLAGDAWLAGPGLLQCRLAHAACAGRRDGFPPAGSLGDYWVYRDGDDFLLFDAGPVGPDHLPAHAHADLLSFEASLDGRRLFVDSGVFSYEDDPLRRYCRSSAAHNVLQVDGADQCDVWSRFRMGYRGRPFGFCCGRASGFHWARACHNAYRRLGVPAVGRWMACRPGGPWLGVDWARGRGRHDLAHRLHVHPDVAVTQVADDEVRLEVGRRQCRLRYLTPGKITIADGWYCAELGRRRPAPVVLWTAPARLPAVCGWSLVWGEQQGSAGLELSGAGEITLRWTEAQGTTQMRPIQEGLRDGPMHSP